MTTGHFVITGFINWIHSGNTVDSHANE